METELKSHLKPLSYCFPVTACVSSSDSSSQCFQAKGNVLLSDNCCVTCEPQDIHRLFHWLSDVLLQHKEENFSNFLSIQKKHLIIHLADSVQSTATILVFPQFYNILDNVLTWGTLASCRFLVENSVLLGDKYRTFWHCSSCRDVAVTLLKFWCLLSSSFTIVYKIHSSLLKRSIY